MSGFVPATPAAMAPRPAGVPVDRIVIHTMEGSYEGSVRWATYTRQQRAESFQKREGGTVEAWLKDPRTFPTCAHYYVSRTGDATQMVADEQQCWHGNSWNARSIGIEHEGRAAVDDFPRAMLEKSARMTAVLCRKFKIPVDRTHIVGHVEVPGATHVDPGAFWPWNDYIALVRAA